MTQHELGVEILAFLEVPNNARILIIPGLTGDTLSLLIRGRIFVFFNTDEVGLV